MKLDIFRRMFQGARNALHSHTRAVNKSHHYFELAYCLSSLIDFHALHFASNGGLAIVVILALIAHADEA